MAVAAYLNKRGKVLRTAPTGRGLMNQPTSGEPRLVASQVPYFIDESINALQASKAAPRPIEEMLSYSLLIVPAGTDIQEGDIFELQNGKGVTVVNVADPGEQGNHIECAVSKSE